MIPSPVEQKMVHSTEANRPIDPLAVDADGAARLLGVSVRHWWALHSSGRCPRPIALGRARRWAVDELRAWLAAGCPERSKWETMKVNP